MPDKTAFRKDTRGAIALEFALLMPVMTVLVFGGITTTRLVRASMKLWTVAQSLTDMVAQQTTVTSSQMTDFCKGATVILAPFTGSIKATVASVTNTATGTITSAPVVDWQDTSCGAGSTIASALTLGTPYVPNVKDSVIIVQVTYTYSFPPSYVLPASMTLTRITYSRPRSGTKVAHG